MSREPPGATEGSARHRLQHANVFISKGTQGDGAGLADGPTLPPLSRALQGSGQLQEGGRPEQREEEQGRAGGWPGNARAAGQQHPDPVEVPTDVGVNTRPVGPPAA